MCAASCYSAPSPIKRKNIVLKNGETHSHNVIKRSDCQVLVINSSDSMAKEMTHQLTVALPGCSIMYAPTLELARWILNRRNIDLVVSSPMLPDGSISKLSGALANSSAQPDLVVVGPVNPKLRIELQHGQYAATTCRTLGTQHARPPALLHTPKKKRDLTVSSQETSICELGADLRNDLNNPLQEIVAMVFVAQQAQASEISPSTQTALDAIDQAAKNMAEVVKNLEGKIRLAVTSPAKDAL